VLPLSTAAPAARLEPDAIGPAKGGLLPASSGETVRGLLAERARLTAQLTELDAGGERLTRAVQRVGGVTNAGRPFNAAPPVQVTSSSELDGRVRQLFDEMQELTGTISAQELKLQELERPARRRRALTALVTLIVIAAIAGAIVLLAVR
jgi:hypothetical protein